jgi:hypothetical protein
VIIRPARQRVSIEFCSGLTAPRSRGTSVSLPLRQEIQAVLRKGEAGLSLSGRRRRACALASVRRSNCTCTFRVCSFQEDSAMSG